MTKTLRIFLLDAALVVAFVIIGTRNHDTDTGASGVFGVAAPFLIGLTAGWLASQAWKQPSKVETGVLIWVLTIVVGMVLRHFAWDDGTAGAFVVVATIFNAFTLVGWRVIRENFTKKQPRESV